MSDKKTIQIGGVTYVLTHARASVALRAAATLANGFAPLVNGVRRGKGGEWDKLLLGVAEMMSDPALAANSEALCTLLSPFTQVVYPDGSTRGLGDVFETHFAGRFQDMLEWLKAAVEYDLGGFLGDMKAKMREVKSADAPASASASPPVASPTG